MKVFTVINSADGTYCGTFSSKEKAEEYIRWYTTPPSEEELRDRYEKIVSRYFEHLQDVLIPSYRAQLELVQSAEYRRNFITVVGGTGEDSIKHTQECLKRYELELKERRYWHSFKEFKDNWIKDCKEDLEGLEIIESDLDLLEETE